MPYEAAKCPNCGGELQLDNDMETGFCVHCGSKIIVRDAIQKMKVEISGLSSVENDLLRGKQSLEAKDWQNAFQFFHSAVDKDADNFVAWMGCLTAMTQDFTSVDYKWVKIDGVNGVEAMIKNCMHYANPEQQQEIRQRLKNMLQSMQNTQETLQQEKTKQKKNINIRLLMSFIFTVAFGATAFLLWDDSGYNDEFVAFIEIMGAVLSGLIGLVCLSAFYKNLLTKLTKDFRDKDALQYIHRINQVLMDIDSEE